MATLMKVVRMHEFGDVNVLRYEDVERPEPQTGEVLIRVRAAGINRIDIASRQRPIPTTTGAQGTALHPRTACRAIPPKQRLIVNT